MAAVCPQPSHAYGAPAPYAETPAHMMSAPPMASEGYHNHNAYPQHAYPPQHQYQQSAPIPTPNYGHPPQSVGYGVSPNQGVPQSYPVGSTPPDMPRAPYAQPTAPPTVPPRGASDVIDLLDELFATPNINVNSAPPQPQHVNFAPTQIATPVSVSPAHVASTSPVPPPAFDHGMGGAPHNGYQYQGHAVPGHTTPPPAHTQTIGYAPVSPVPASVSPVPPAEGQTQWATTMQPIQPASAPYAPQPHYSQPPQGWQQGTTIAGVPEPQPHQQPPTAVSPVPPAPQAAHPGYPITPPWQQANAAPVEMHQTPPPPHANWGPPAEPQYQQPTYSVPVHTAYGVPADVQQSQGYPTYQPPTPVVASPQTISVASPASSETYNMDETAAQLRATEDRIAELKRQIAERARAAGQAPPQPAGGVNHLQSDEEMARRLQEEENEAGRGGGYAPPPVMDAAALRRQQELEDEAFARQLEEQERGGTGQSQPAASTLRRVHFASVSEQQTLDDEALARQLQDEEERAVNLRNSFALNRPPPMAPSAAQPQQPRPEWVPDNLADACMNERCNIKFRTLGAHRHHCRGCGLVFCDSCSKYRRVSADKKSERVCFTCHNR